jgi:hypothetical protein
MLNKKDDPMASIDEQILRTSKEIVVKFIETGRVSPTGFHETFKSIYTTVKDTVKDTAHVIEKSNIDNTKDPNQFINTKK